MLEWGLRRSGWIAFSVNWTVGGWSSGGGGVVIIYYIERIAGDSGYYSLLPLLTVHL